MMSGSEVRLPLGPSSSTRTWLDLQRAVHYKAMEKDS